MFRKLEKKKIFFVEKPISIHVEKNAKTLRNKTKSSSEKCNSFSTIFFSVILKISKNYQKIKKIVQRSIQRV